MSDSFFKGYVQEQDKELEKVETQKKFYEAQSIALRAQHDLEKLSSSLNQLVSELGTQQGGYKFQDWFYDLMGYFDITAKKPYVTDGRQIDGTITLKDTTYLIELKFTSGQAGAEDIDTFLRKVQTKSDNTMGIFVSMSGFSSVATTMLLAPGMVICHDFGLGLMEFPGA